MKTMMMTMMVMMMTLTMSGKPARSRALAEPGGATASTANSSYEYACFPSLFSFGDSKADTGNLQAAFPTESRSEGPPYGISYFGHPSDRFCDGRLAIDFQGN
jgi:hypothetical protein